MEKYIPKSSLVAEINKRIMDAPIDCYGHQRVWAYNDVKDIIDTLEVKELDLEKEINDSMPSKYCWSGDGKAVYTKEQMVEFAKHFFELGAKASNPLTWEDMMIIHKCCKDAMNNNLYEWHTQEGQKKIYEEVLKRFKVQKGEEYDRR